MYTKPKDTHQRRPSGNLCRRIPSPHNKYIFFTKVARNEGLHYIANILEETAINEEQHAKDQFKLLKQTS